MTHISPLLRFRREAREALEFYRSVFGGDLRLETYADLGAREAGHPDADLIMYGKLDTPWGSRLVAVDEPWAETAKRGAVSIWFSGTDPLELRSCWTRLSHGATVTRTLDVAPWGDSFGMLVDKFEVPWEVSIHDSGEVYRRH
ncbi:VOC family protein [Agromyces seonyuensis]|uniref:VOC family protein n=1 Tax=Agromyces seonyuensis TaxID=2662446 RepID=A0A6I4P6Q1_9MICO|nr:VOC family protein [Agromyces seonyuensis]